MNSKPKWIRTLGFGGVCLVVSFIAVIAFLRFEGYRYQRRAQRLMADVQALKLRHSGWREAERVIDRWGRYGDYRGHCDASYCRYSVVLKSPATTLESKIMPALRGRFAERSASLFFLMCDHLGGRSFTLRTNFVVQSGVILRKGAVFIYDVPPTLAGSSGYSLIAASHATNRLASDAWALTSSEQLAKHPFYIVTRPGGCSFCLMANVAFTPDTPEPELRRLITFDLNCITGLHACRYLEDIYPATEEWHLYDDTLGGRSSPSHQVQTPNATQPLACRVPLFARGRDASQILSVAAVSSSQEQQSGGVLERARVRLNGLLKGKTEYKPGEIITVTSRSDSRYLPSEIEVSLQPGNSSYFCPSIR